MTKAAPCSPVTWKAPSPATSRGLPSQRLKPSPVLLRFCPAALIRPGSDSSRISGQATPAAGFASSSATSGSSQPELDDDVHVEHGDVVAARLGQGEVDRPGVAAVGRGAQQADLARARPRAARRSRRCRRRRRCPPPAPRPAPRRRRQQRRGGSPRGVRAVVVDDYDRDQLDEPSSASRLIRPLKIEMKSAAESICRPRTRKLVESTSARVSVKTLLPAHWIGELDQLGERASISRTDPRPATPSRNRTEITRSSHRGGSLPASTP